MLFFTYDYSNPAVKMVELSFAKMNFIVLPSRCLGTGLLSSAREKWYLYLSPGIWVLVKPYEYLFVTQSA